MDLPLRLLPIAERWSCHGCGICCRHVLIHLSPEEYQRIRDQGWDRDSELRNKKLFVRTRLWPPRYRLAHTPEGYCVFLSDQGRCRIHERFGAEAKPLVCRMFPYQTVALDKFAYLTLRHNCPSVVRKKGALLADQEDEWRPLAEHPRLRPTLTPPPPLTVHYRGSWSQFLRAAGVVERLICQDSYPMVRRLAHALIFAQTLDACRLSRLSQEQYIDLLNLIEQSVAKEAETYFLRREAPRWSTEIVFRRTLLDYLRLHPGFPVEASWRGRLRWIHTSLAVALGRGYVPKLANPELSLQFRPDRQGEGHDATQGVSLAELDKSLVGLPRDIWQPLDEYYETMSISRRFAVNSRPGWALTDRVRALAASFPVALALLRLGTPGRKPIPEDMTAVVVTLDRGEGFAPLTGATYRRRLRALARRDQLIRLVVWAAR